MTRAFASQRGWRSMIMISWRYHLARAHRIFDVSFAPPNRTGIMRDVPNTDPFAVAQ